MKFVKLIDSEVIETRNVFNFPDGRVTVVEREVHEAYSFEPARSPRLVIIDALENFVARSRSEITGLSTLMQELSSAK
ncbi:MAG: hypothetical protein PSX80_03765 [bacterium]|nr:hypothetical protein [bacterium]